MNNYSKLEYEIEKIQHIKNSINILNWDIAVNTPKGSIESRSREIAELSKITDERLLSPKLIELIENINLEELDEWQKANVREIRRDIRESSYLNHKQKEEYILATTKCEYAWRQAKQENNYNVIKPHLSEVISYVVELATKKSELLNVSKYQALVDIYDPDCSLLEITNNFNELKIHIPQLIPQIVEKQAVEKFIPIESINHNLQKKISIRIMEIMGFDFSKGRIDDSTHPFCMGTPYDTRITNRYDANNFISGVMGVIHETGHALYEQSLPVNYKNQSVGRAKGMAIHESQSLIMEMQIGRTREFCAFLSKLLRDEFQLTGEMYSEQNLYLLNTRVKPSCIRVDADEVTYPMHIILRSEIEELLINKTLDLADLPSCWNDKMSKYLGIISKDNKNGCLQDIHWFMGNFGYFPSYINGAIIASSLMKNAIQQADVMHDIEIGKFTSINKYLNKNIRSKGSFQNRNSLLMSAIGTKYLNSSEFVFYLKNKYLS